MKKWSVVMLVLVLVLVLAGAGVLYGIMAERMQMNSLMTQPAPQTSEPAQPDQNQTGDTGQTESELFPAPEFTVYDLEGNEVKLSDRKGKPVILNFWATWCGYCVQEMPEFEAMYQEYGDRIHFMMVNATDNSQETVEKASAFIADKGYTFPVYYDTQFSAVIAYRVNAMPVTFFIDSQGNLITYVMGAVSRDTLQQGVDLLLAEG